MNGAELIAAERQRQINVEGFDMAHDDEHDESELVMAAICYAAPINVYVDDLEANYPAEGVEDPWPWSKEWDKRQAPGCSSADRQRALVKAGALIAAEIDRLQRKAAAELAKLYPQPS